LPGYPINSLQAAANCTRHLFVSASVTPADSAYAYAGDVKRGSYISNFVTADVGNVAYYKVCYKSTHGDLGAFSPVVSALIG
jgi:hypothetical protein